MLFIYFFYLLPVPGGTFFYRRFKMSASLLYTRWPVSTGTSQWRLHIFTTVGYREVRFVYLYQIIKVFQSPFLKDHLPYDPILYRSQSGIQSTLALRTHRFYGHHDNTDSS